MIDKNSLEWLNAECDTCGKRFHDKLSHYVKCKNHYCSRECHRQAKMIYMRGEGNHQYGLKGQLNSSWKGDRKESRYGYVQVRMLDHPYRDKEGFVFEHRLIAEEYLLNAENSIEIDGKRYLSPDYVVHHKNFDRKDNRIDNLMVMTNAAHQRLHCSLNINERDEKTHRFTSTKLKYKYANSSVKNPIEKDGYFLCGIYEKVDIKPHNLICLDTGIVPVVPDGHIVAMYKVGKLANKDQPLYKNCVVVNYSEIEGTLRTYYFNDTDKSITLMPDDMIFAFTYLPQVSMELEIVDKLDETDRADSGFGSISR